MVKDNVAEKSRTSLPGAHKCHRIPHPPKKIVLPGLGEAKDLRILMKAGPEIIPVSLRLTSFFPNGG